MREARQERTTTRTKESRRFVMRLWHFSTVALALSASLSLTLLSGCGGGKTTSGGTEEKKDEKKGDDTDKKKKEALKPGKATITGTVTLEGDEPDIDDLNKKQLADIEKKAED